MQNTPLTETYKLPDLDLRDDPDVETAAKRIFKECVIHLQTNFGRFLENADEPALMQIRIGMRRTRVAMKIFRQIIHPEIRHRFTREFRYFGNLMGEARDMDVFLNGMLDENCPVPDLAASYEELRRHAERMRDEEYSIIEQELTGGRFQTQLEILDDWQKSDWSKHLGRSGTKLLKTSIKPFAIDVMEDGRMDLLSQGAFIDELSTEELHRVRKFVKRSRYHLRFFTSLFKQEKMNEGYDILVQMQDSLGHINDVKEGLLLMSRLGGDVQADHLSSILQLIASKVASAGEEVETHLSSFRDFWHQYEEFSISEEDLVS